MHRLALCLVLLTACGDDDAPLGPDARAVLDSGAAADGPHAADGPSAADASSRPADAAAPSADADPNAPDSGGGGTGATCGGFLGSPCAKTHYCDYPDDICGAADGTGVCVERPFVCTEEYAPVCGCDGTVYGNQCGAHQAGTDVSNFSGCTPPAGMFACGHRFCDLELTYCQRTTSDVFGIPDDFACLIMPGACPEPPDCACLAGEACGDLCAKGDDGGLTLTCPGG